MKELFWNLYNKLFKKKIKSKELWNLDITIIEWLVPRLKAFKEQTDGYPGNITWDEWMSILDSIIKGLEAYNADRDWDENLSTEENLELDKEYYIQKTTEFRRAMGLLTKYFGSLWW